MAEFDERYTISGPRGSKSGTTFIDTGATFTVLPKSLADELGIAAYRPETVDTNNGPVQWEVGRAEVSIGGKPSRDQDVFIAPEGNPIAIGAETLEISGFRLRANSARARLAICQGCEAMVPHPYLGPTCSDCGCLLQAKVRLPGQSCPRGNW
jgi:predicted aspartyl protease